MADRRLLYGSGLRLMECLRLRVKDLDFTYGQLTVRDGKGEKDRITMLPTSLTQQLKHHLEKVRLLHLDDLHAGYGEVYLPYALERKYLNAPKDWGWQYVFPAARSVDSIRGAARNAVIIYRTAPFKLLSRTPCEKPRSTNAEVVTRSVTASRPICWKTVTTFEPSRNC